MASSPRPDKRPGLGTRSSSSSTHLGQSPSSLLSTSAQNRKTHRQQHVVGRSGMGARIPSVGKINRLGSKLALAPLQPFDEPSSQSQRPTHIKRNSSNLHLAKAGGSHTNLRKNQSDTSLRKNRSSTQIQKLPRASSSKALHKKSKSDGKARHRDISDQIKLPGALQNPTVRFDLGDDEDAWTDNSASQSPNTTRSNSQKNSVILEPPTSHTQLMPQTGNEDDEDDDEASQQTSPTNPLRSPVIFTPNTPKTPAGSKSPEQDSPETQRTKQITTPNRNLNADRITSRLLKRNVSFSAAPTKVSSISASGSHDRQSPPQYRERAGSAAESPEHGGLSRMSNVNSTAGTPQRESNFLPHAHTFSNFPDNYTNGQLDLQQRRQHPNASVSGPASRADSPRSGILTPSMLPPSRTQQKLWLERASSNLENQQILHPGLLRPGRLGGGPMQLHSVNSEEVFQKQLKQLFEQTDNVYRRIRTFQNPLADAVTRLQDVGIVPKAKLVQQPRRPGSRGGRNPVSGLGDGAYGLSQSYQPHQTRNSRDNASEHGGAGGAGAVGVSSGKKPKVSFQGLSGSSVSRDDSDLILGRESGLASRKTNFTAGMDGEDDDDYPENMSAVDDVRELCRRLWERQIAPETE